MPMERPPHEHPFETDPFAEPDRGVALAETDPWGLGESPEAAAIPNSTHDSREVYLRMPSRVWATVHSRLRFDRRIVAGLVLVGVASALLVGLSRSEVAPSIKTLSGTTYNTALDRLASAVGAALDLAGLRPVDPVTTVVASSSKKETPSVSRKRGPINSSRTLPLIPLISPEAVQANGSAPINSADVDATVETMEALLPAVDTSIIYSPTDTDISPPVAVRSPGIATDRGNREQNILLVDILVNETGGVESVRGRPHPATLGAALQSNMALSVVKTWRFSPARKDGQPVKYRTTVPFVETMNVARQD